MHFRECSKIIQAKVIDRQDDKETEARLDVWCNNSNDSIAIAVQKQEDNIGESEQK